MSTYELLDELEAGELSIQYEGEEPQALLEWAIGEFSPRLAISAAFQADDVALIDMAYKIDPNVRIFTGVDRTTTHCAPNSSAISAIARDARPRRC